MSQTNLTIVIYMMSISLTYQAGHVAGLVAQAEAFFHVTWISAHPRDAVLALLPLRHTQLDLWRLDTFRVVMI
jgi:hypothetical protein